MRAPFAQQGPGPAGRTVQGKRSVRGRARQRAHFQIADVHRPTIIRGPVCGRFHSGGAGTEHGDADGSRLPGPRYKRPGTCFGLDAACGDVLWPFPPAPADRPSPVAGQGTPKGKKCVLPAAGDARPKGLKPGEGPRSAPAVGPEQARAHKRGGLGGCNISAVRQLQLYVLRRGTSRARSGESWARAGRCGLPGRYASSRRPEDPTGRRTGGAACRLRHSIAQTGELLGA